MAAARHLPPGSALVVLATACSPYIYENDFSLCNTDPSPLLQLVLMTSGETGMQPPSCMQLAPDTTCTQIGLYGTWKCTDSRS